MEGNGRGNYLVFRRIAEMLQIRHNAPRNRKNGGEFPLLKMKEGSSRSLSGCLARGRFSLHAPSIQVIQPPVARDCTVKKTHFSKLKLSVAPIVLGRSEEHTSEPQSLIRISYAVFCLKKKKKTNRQN